MSLKRWFALVIIAGISHFSCAAEGGERALLPVEQTSSEGYFTLKWDPSISNNNTQLQMSLNRDFRQILQSYPLPSEGKITLSGYATGDYYFRLHNLSPNHQPENIQSHALVKVSHRSLESAIQLFILGILLFAGLVVCIFKFSKSESSI